MKKIILTLAAFLIANAPTAVQNQVPGNNEFSLGNRMSNISEEAVSPPTPNIGSVSGRAVVKAEFPGIAVSICIKVGDEVEIGDTLTIIESMKTTYQVKATCAGTVTEIYVREGQSIEYDELLVSIDNSLSI